MLIRRPSQRSRDRQQLKGKLVRTLFRREPVRTECFAFSGIPMKKRLSVELLTILTLSSLAASASVATDEAEIRGIISDQVAAWNAGDGGRYATRLAPDASFTNIFGTVMYGAPAFAKRNNEILSTFYKGTSKVHLVRRIRFITPDVAIVDIDNEVHNVKSMPGGIAVPPGGVVKTQLMEVFARRDGHWWIEAYHNVDLKPTTKP